MIEICRADNCDREAPTGHDVCRRCAALARGNASRRSTPPAATRTADVGDITKENPHGHLPTCRECSGPFWKDIDGVRHGPYAHFGFCSHAGSPHPVFVLHEMHHFTENYLIRPDEPDAQIEGHVWAALKAVLTGEQKA